MGHITLKDKIVWTTQNTNKNFNLYTGKNLAFPQTKHDLIILTSLKVQDKISPFLIKNTKKETYLHTYTGIYKHKLLNIHINISKNFLGYITQIISHSIVQTSQIIPISTKTKKKKKKKIYFFNTNHIGDQKPPYMC